MRDRTTRSRNRPRPGGSRWSRGERAGVTTALAVTAVGVVLTLGGTGSSAVPAAAAAEPQTLDEAAAAQARSADRATGDDRVFPGGRALSTYRPQGHQSYRWRVNILDHDDELLRDLRTLRLDPRTAELGASRYENMVATCADLRSGEDAQRAAMVRWSSTTEPIKAKTARNVVAVVSRSACPRLAPS